METHSMEVSIHEAEALSVIDPENLGDYIEKNGDLMRKVTMENLDVPAEELAELIKTEVSNVTMIR